MTPTICSQIRPEGTDSHHGSSGGETESRSSGALADPSSGPAKAGRCAAAAKLLVPASLGSTESTLKGAPRSGLSYGSCKEQALVSYTLQQVDIIVGSTSRRGAQMRLVGHPMRRRRSRGQALVEFSLVIPVFLTVFFSIVEFSFLFTSYVSVGLASHDAVQLAATYGNTNGADAAILLRVSNDVM